MTLSLSYLSDPDYAKAQRHLQLGHWRSGLAALVALHKRYPDDAELRRLVVETRVRSKIDKDERADGLHLLRRRLLTWLLRLIVLALALGAVSWAVQSYSNVMAAQMAVARAAVEQQALALERATQLTNAQALLRAGRLSEAQALLDQLAAVDPAYPGLQPLVKQARLLGDLERQYAEAMGRVGGNDLSGALPLLREIVAVNPNYKDAALQLEAIEQQVQLQDLRTEAEAAFTARRWVDAIAAYESLRVLEPDYHPVEVETRLFESYVEAAQAALVGGTDSLEALQRAEGFFRKALVLRPQDREIKHERERARLYLAAQQDFGAGRWTAVITGLSLLLVTDPEYANGSARQTLYEAYVARGDGAMLAGAYEAALADYQAAVDLAEQDEAAVLRLYEATVRVGDAQAAHKAYETAVLNYRRAVQLGRLEARAADHASLANALAQAVAAVNDGNFSLAYERYRQAVSLADTTQATITHVVQPGDYLILIATRHHSTVQAIVDANNIPNPRLIYAGQNLIVPVLP